MNQNYHQTQSDRHGVHYDRLSPENNHVSDKDFGIIPFRAIVVAYYGKSQMVDVIYQREGSIGFLSGVDVYGSHGNLLGTLETPDIGAEESKLEYGYNLDPIKNPDKVEIGESKNNIECLVKKTTDGFATSEFRALNEDNPLWMNAKKGRKITSYADGSYKVSDKDGNIEFVHVSGFRIKIGDSVDPIVLDDKMGVHQLNKANYVGKTNYLVEHPLGGKTGFDPTGKLIAENSIGKVGVDILEASIDEIVKVIDEIVKIIVAQGTGPDIAALTLIKTSLTAIKTKTGQIYG